MNKQQKISALQARANEAIRTAQANEQAAGKRAVRKTFILSFFGLDIEVSSRKAIDGYLRACAQTTAVKMRYAAILGAVGDAAEINELRGEMESGLTRTKY